MDKSFGIQLIFISLGIFAFSFTRSSVEKIEPYFQDYDEVLWFTHSLKEVYLNNDNSENIDKGQIPFLFHSLSQIKTENLVSDLFHNGYLRKNINKKHFTSLDSIFCLKKSDFDFGTTCIKVYRDYIIFRKKRGKKIMGVAQICFSCRETNFLFSKQKTKGFGQFGEYKRLLALRDI